MRPAGKPIAAPVALVMLRHGQTDWNEAGRYQGHADPPLNAAGRAQAGALAAEMARISPSAILSSPLQRARETAARIAAVCGGAVTVDARLKELSFGRWEGLVQADVKARWPDALRQWKRAPDTLRLPEGETLAEAAARLASLLRMLAGARGPVALVSHDAIIRIAILAATGQPLAAFRSIKVANASLTRFHLHRPAAGGDAPRLQLAMPVDAARWSTI
ncbi:MAG: histidine phosphatase family protein [Rhodospirillales bacterium]|nr:phosphoglycerate mutase family protein [Rhodospirillales bacterium]MDE2198081.1 histidine phosphatase family protein [Rhodospirillales bacterium]MDE2573916.1 histidine phosphatase family protein [Rhodospirillales bacterium]